MSEDFDECSVVVESDRDRIIEAELTLDRTIGFVRNSDEKTSIALTMVGVILTIIFTLSGENIMRMLNAAYENLDWASGLFVILFVLFLSLTVYGIYKLLRVIVPKLDSIGFEDENLDKDSKIFFGTISKNKTYTEYRDKLNNLSDEAYLNDLWSQIYINAQICNRKFRNFSSGLKIGILNLFLLLATVVVFSFLILG